MNRKTMVVLGLLTVALLATPALATLGEGVSGTVLGRGAVSEAVKVREPNGTEFVAQQITIQPGGHTGWHTHPGAALVVVTSGTLTVTNFREGRSGDTDSVRNGPRCLTLAYAAGQSFVDPGHGNVHIGRNLGTTPVELRVTYTGVPPAGAFRIDAADPGC
jgi:Cupin domain